MKSASLPPLTDSRFGLFVKSQFGIKAKQPPSETSLAGKTAIITGSNVGIGLECARVFLDLGISRLILAVRTVKKGEEAALPLRRKHPKATVEVWSLDMLSYESVQEFAQKCADISRLDIAILNAGMTATTFKVNSSTGYEETLQVNYLSTALLAILLLPTLKQRSPSKSPGRLTIVSSGLALQAAFPNRDARPLLPSFNNGTNWNISAASERYSVTKTLELMLVRKLGDLVKQDDVVINAVDPGFTGGSQLHRNAPLAVRPIIAVIKAVSARSITHAAWSYVDAAVVRGAESHGDFLMNWETYPFHPMMYTSEGKQTEEQLWEETLKELDFANVGGIIRSL